MAQPIPKEADEFNLPGSGDVGVLLIHGYTGSPAEMRLLGDYINEKGGYTVLGVRLAGHGTTVEELEQTVWQDWYEAVEEGIRQMIQKCPRIYVAGQSMGGLLAIKAAAELPVEKVALLATPVFLQDKRVPFIKFLRFFIPRLKTGQQSYDVPEQYMQGYSEMPTKPIISLMELIGLCRKEYLQKIKIPTLIVQGKMDHTVNPKSATYLYEALRNVPESQKIILWLPASRHVVTLGEEREKMYEECLRFFNQ